MPHAKLLDYLWEPRTHAQYVTFAINTVVNMYFSYCHASSIVLLVSKY